MDVDKELFYTLILDFCDIPTLIEHLQANYRFWKDEEENPTANYDLSQQGQRKNSASTINTLVEAPSDSDENKTGEKT